MYQNLYQRRGSLPAFESPVFQLLYRDALTLSKAQYFLKGLALSSRNCGLCVSPFGEADAAPEAGLNPTLLRYFQASAGEMRTLPSNH